MGPATVVVPKGMGTADIAALLKEGDVIETYELVEKART